MAAAAEVLGQLEDAEKYKEAGNTFFKEGNYKKALGNYHKVFLYVNGLQVPGEKSEAASYADMMGKSSASQVPADRVEGVKKLKQSTHLNMAACYLKTQEYKKCVDACSKALAAAGEISKAFFRRGQANLELGNLDEAKRDFLEAKRLAPEDPAIPKEMARLKQAYAQHDAKERCHYEETGVAPPRQKLNQWAAYTNKARIQRYVTDCVEFLKQNADCRCRPLSQSHMRFYVLLQHFVSEDTMDFYRPEMQRKHQDSFEGRLTNGVNAQLVKDAHRSEFTVDGQTFSLQERGQDPECKQYEERVAEIARYSEEFLLTLERFLMDYCNRRGLSLLARQRLVQAVTTQMSQAGLANLDRASQCTRYFVGSQGLTQHTAYNLSTLDSSEHGETLKLTVYCMKTGFSQYLDKDEVLRMSGVDCPKRCGPRSYLYQYATLNFRPGPLIDSCETTICTLLDALDEAHIEPATTAT